MPTVDFLPVAISGTANVDTQAAFVGSGYQENGMIAGTATSKQANKVWRQSSMMTAALANFISTVLNVDVLDDGNLGALIANLTSAFQTASSIGFTPVQQGGGTGQNTNKIFIGWDQATNRLKCTVDATDEGNFVFDAQLTPVSTVANNAATAAATVQTNLTAFQNAQATENTALDNLAQEGVNNAATAQAAANAANTAIAALVTRGALQSNANGSWIEWSDGLFEMWGQTNMPSSGATTNSVAVVFPHTFTTIPTVQTTLAGETGAGDATTPPSYGLQAQPTDNGFTLFAAKVVIASEGGGNFDNAMTVHWYAKGK